MAVQGQIAENARGEMPLSWDALAKTPTSGEAILGEPFLRRKVVSAMFSLFGRELTDVEEAALHPRVADYAGKLVALSIITPARDYWNKQALSLGATGRNETKAYMNRAAELTTIRAELIAATRAMWPEVESLLPNRNINRVASIPRTQKIISTVTPDPDAFEAPFAS